MAWIESHQSLAKHPKTLRLARVLGISKVQVVGHLHYLWWWSLDYAEDGDLSDFDQMDIAIAAEWEGEPQVFWNALTEVGFIADGHIHDWDDYAGRLVRQREANRERQARRRERLADAEKAPVTPRKRARNAHVPSLESDSPRESRERHAVVTRDSHESHTATVPNRTVPNPPVVPPATTQSTPPPVPAGGDERQRRPLAPPTETWALIESVFAVTGADPQVMSETERSRQGGIARRLLRDHDAADIVTCAQWLWSQPWHQDRGIDLLTIQQQMTRWITAGMPRAAPSRASPNGPIRPVPAYYQDFPNTPSPQPSEHLKEQLT